MTESTPAPLREGPLWELVHAALDQGRDPFADPDIVEGCADRPETAAEIVALLDDLEQLRTAPVVVPPSRRARWLAAAALLIAALAVGGWLLDDSADSTAPDGDVVAVADDAPAPTATVRTWRVTASLQVAHETTETVELWGDRSARGVRRSVTSHATGTVAPSAGTRVHHYRTIVRTWTPNSRLTRVSP